MHADPRHCMIGFPARCLSVFLAMGIVAAGSDSAGPDMPPGRVIVIAHRGASALLPEHTLAAYARAIADGADFIEPDLVPTRDGVLVARHESEIGSTTNVSMHPEFQGRKTKKQIDGRVVEGWFTEDFTLDELRTLRARERLPALRGRGNDDRFGIPTLDDVIDLVAAEAARTHRTIGLIPEIKHGSHFRAQGLAMEARLLRVLDAHPYTRTAPVVVQSLEAGTLLRLKRLLGNTHPNVTLLQLLGDPAGSREARLTAEGNASGAPTATPAGLRRIAGYAQAIGPELRAVIPWDRRHRLGAETGLVRDAHAAGLKVFVYTFRPENRFIAAQFNQASAPDARNDQGSVDEMRAYLATGIDGLFTDDPRLGREAVDGWKRRIR